MENEAKIVNVLTFNIHWSLTEYLAIDKSMEEIRKSGLYQ